MTQKELLYLEDAYMHEDSIISIINESIDKLSDEELINFMNEEVNRHQKIRDSLMNLLEECVND